MARRGHEVDERNNRNSVNDGARSWPGPLGDPVDVGLVESEPHQVAKSRLRMTQWTPFTLSTTWLTSKSPAALR